MPGQQDLIQLFDVPQAEADKQRMMGFMDELQTKIKEFSAVSLGAKSVNSMAEYRKSSTELTAALQQMADMQKKLVELENQLANTRTKNSPKARTDDEIRASVAARAEMKNRVDAIKAEDDAYKQLALTYNKAAAEAKRLQAEALKGGDKGAADAATARAKSLSDQLKGIDHPVGDDRRNVGNYLEAIKSLEPDLQRLRQQMEAMRSAGREDTAQFKQMAEQLRALETISSQQAKGFMGLTQQLRFMERGLQTMRAAGLEHTEAFKEMRVETAKAREEFREFAEQQKILASDAPILTSLTVAVKGLAGAYAVGQGAVSLFADGNEKLEKDLNKGVAIMTMLQGLQEAHELLQKRGAIAVAFQAAAEKIRNFILTGSTTALKEKSVAEVVNTEAEEANTVATEANIVAQEGQAAATEAVTVATEGSTAAMVALRVALIATGIGALLLLLPLAASAFGLFAKNAKEAAKEALELDEMVNQLNETIMKQIELEKAYSEGQRQALQENLTYAEKAGKNFYELLAIRKRIAEVDAEDAANALKRTSGQTDVNNALRKTTDEIEGQGAQLHGLQVIHETMQKAFIAGYDKMSESQRKEAKEALDNDQKRVEEAQKGYDAKVKLLKDYNDTQTALNAVGIEGEKFSEDEKRQYAIASAEVRADAMIRANERIINDERSTQEQIIAAMDRSLNAQLSKIEAQKTALGQQAANKEVTPAEYAKQLQSFNDAEQAAIDKNNEEKRKKNYEYYVRDRNARVEIQKLEAEDQAKANGVIIADQKATYEQKLKALTDQYNARKVAIGADLGKDLDTPGMRDSERNARLAKAESDLQALRIDYAKQYETIAKENQEKILKSWEGYYAAEAANINTKEAQELIALNNSFDKKVLSASRYEQKRKEIENKAAIERLQNQVAHDYLLLNSTKEGTVERKKAEEVLSKDTLALSEEIAKQKEEKTKKDAAIKSSALEVYDLTTSLVDDQYQKEINRINRRIELNTEMYDKEKKDIANSTLSATERAAQLQIIDAKAAAEQHRLEQQRRQEEQRQAIFDRDAAVLKITANTLIGASATTPPWISPEAIAIEIAGAAEVTALLAKPIPHYEVGTDNHPGGPMVVHPGELRVDPDGTVTKTPDQATLTWGEPGTKIIPAHEVRQMMMNDILFNAQSMNVDKNGELMNGLSELKQEIRQGLHETVSAIRKIPTTQVIVYDNSAHLEHIKRST